MTTQLLIYERAVPVNSGRHATMSVKSGDDYSFAGQVNSVPLLAVEFPRAASEYAIVFAGQGAEAPWPSEGVLVLAVGAGGQAETLGLRPGDVLTSYGERVIADAASLTRAIEEREGAAALPVRVRRGHEDLTVQAGPGALGIDAASAPPPVAGPRLLREGPVAQALRSAAERGRDPAALPGTRAEVQAVRAAFLLLSQPRCR